MPICLYLSSSIPDSDCTSGFPLALYGSHQIEAAEEEWDFLRRGLGRVRAMDGVALDILAEVTADRSRSRLLRIGRAHLLAPARDCLVAFKHHQDDGSGRHIGAQIVVEWARLMDLIEALRLCAREMR